MHMPVNKPNVNCTYDSSHGTDEIYPKGPPHIYIYNMCMYIYMLINPIMLNIPLVCWAATGGAQSAVGFGRGYKRLAGGAIGGD